MVILAQQAIGLLGESVIFLGLMGVMPFAFPDMATTIADGSYAQLSESILRFIQFDAFGLIIMIVSFVFFLYACRDTNSIKSEIV